VHRRDRDHHPVRELSRSARRRRRVRLRALSKSVLWRERIVIVAVAEYSGA
jgi:hypothetical protein